MTTTARAKLGQNYKPAPEGTHLARCVQVIDLGTQYSEYYQKSAEKILLGWELPGSMREETEETPPEPYLVWKRYTLSLSDKAKLLEHLEAWRGRKFTAEELEGFDLMKVLDVPCMLSVVHSVEGKDTYANVSSVMAVPKGTNVPDRYHAIVSFDIQKWDEATFDTFGENLKKTIMDSSEYKATSEKIDDAPPVADKEDKEDKEDDEDDEDIPF